MDSIPLPFYEVVPLDEIGSGVRGLQVNALSKLCPRTIAPGHGLPMCGDEVPDQLVRLAINFDHIAIPDHGKYVHKVPAT